MRKRLLNFIILYTKIPRLSRGNLLKFWGIGRKKPVFVGFLDGSKLLEGLSSIGW